MAPIAYFETGPVQIKGNVHLLTATINFHGKLEKNAYIFIDKENPDILVKNGEKGLNNITPDTEGKVNDGTLSVPTDSSIPVEIIKEDLTPC